MKKSALILFALAAMTLAGCAKAADTSPVQESDIAAATSATVTTAPAAATTTTAETTTEAETTTAAATTTTAETTVTTTVSTTKITTTTTPAATKKTTTSKKATTVTTTKAKAVVTQKMSGTMYTNQAANMRKGNGTNYDKVTTLPMNTAVTITGKCDNGWYAVTADGKSGYMSGSVLSSEKTVQKPVTTTARQQEVTTTTQKPTSQEDQARAVAKKIADEIRKEVGNKQSIEQLELVQKKVQEYVLKCKMGESSDPVTYTAYGVFVAGKCDCYGTAKAVGLVLDELGYKWKQISYKYDKTASSSDNWNEVYCSYTDDNCSLWRDHICRLP